MRMLHNGTVTRVRRACYFLLLCALHATAQRFVILGDRTGSPQPGVYEQVWRETAAARPEFVVSVGDTIEGLVDSAANAQWQQWRRLVKPYARIPLYLTPGNHDIWSKASAQLFEKYAGRARHYSFDRGAAHFTVLDNSGSDALSDGEIAFLESDLKAHAAAPLKFIVSHRPSWLMNVALRNPDFGLHRLARQYGVRYVIAGHVHEMLNFELDGVTYISMPSAGGHLRLSGAYRDGWFFAYTTVQASGGAAKFEIHELKAPHGGGRVTALEDWGMLGLKTK